MRVCVCVDSCVPWSFLAAVVINISADHLVCIMFYIIIYIL